MLYVPTKKYGVGRMAYSNIIILDRCLCGEVRVLCVGGFFSAAVPYGWFVAGREGPKGLFLVLRGEFGGFRSSRCFMERIFARVHQAFSFP